MADYVACHNESYVQANKFDVVKFCKRRGNFFLNTTAASIADPDERIQALEELISPNILRTLQYIVLYESVPVRAGMLQ